MEHQLPFIIKFVLWFLLPGVFPPFNATFLGLVEFGFAICGIISVGRFVLMVPRDRLTSKKEIWECLSTSSRPMVAEAVGSVSSSPERQCEERWVWVKQNMTGTLGHSVLKEE